MKYLGIDYGKKKIGLSVSDDSGKVAFPVLILKNEKDETIKKIVYILEERKINEIVIGLSLNYKGADNLITKEAVDFAEKLEKVSGKKVNFEKEYLSTKEANRTIDNKEDDARASAIILQSFLDKKGSSPR
ncbi:MAG: Holliday junction resolvase RuvX [Patescibacteria group bacterium]